MKIQFQKSRSTLWLLVIAAMVVVGGVPPSEARFPHGGWVSRDLERVGDTLWVVSMEDGNGVAQMTAWSFCLGEKADCEAVCLSDDDDDRSECSNVQPDCKPPCKSRHVTGSESQQEYTSPGVSPDGDWVMFGTKDKVLHSFYWKGSTTGWVHSSWSAQRVAQDRCDDGGLVGTKFCKNQLAQPTNDEKKPFASGFHARPLFLELPSGDKIFVAVNVGNNNEAYVHTFTVNNADGKLQPWKDRNPNAQGDVFALRLAGATGYRFDPIEYQDSNGQQRVLVAADDSGTDKFPVRAIGFSIDAVFGCGPNVPCQLGEGPRVGGDTVRKGTDADGKTYKKVKPGARLGGVVLKDAQVGGGSTMDLLVYNLNKGVLAMDLGVGSGGDMSTWGEMKWYRPLDQVHRTKPTESPVNVDRDPNYVRGANPVLYVSQRQGGSCKGGQARVYRLDPGTGEAFAQLDGNDEPKVDGDNYEVDHSGICTGESTDCVARGYVEGEKFPRPMFPGCYEEKIGNASFSSPMVNPRSGHIFFGPAHSGDPIYKVDPRSPQRSWTLDSNLKPEKDQNLRNYARVGWLDYAPTNGWRTNATFSGDHETMYIGSAGGIVYAMDADEPCGVVRWCYDTRGVEDPNDPDGGYCDSTAATNPECCQGLKDESSRARDLQLEHRRIAKQCASCWDQDNELNYCKIAGVRHPGAPDFFWNGTEELSDASAPHDVERAPVLLSLSGGSQTVTFKLQLAEADGSLVSNVRRIEAMNEDTGEIFLDEAPNLVSLPGAEEYYELGVAVCAGSPGSPDPVESIRFGLFDNHGNESMVRVQVTCS